MDHYDMGVCTAIVQLNQGNVVNVKKTSGAAGNLRYPEYGSGFSGFLYAAL